MAKAKVKTSFRDRMTKTISTINTPTFRIGFSNIDLWVECGNYAMNRRWSGRFDRAYLFGRNYIYYGESGSGKSLMAAIAAANAQKQHGALVVWMDTEHATDDEAGKQWLQRAGIDLDNLIYTSLSTLEEIKTVIASMTMEYHEAMVKAQKDGEEFDLPPIVFVVDSWAAALTDSQWQKTGGKEAGKVVGDQGQKAKQTGDVINSVTHLCAGKPIMVIGVQHIMDNQDGYGRKHKVTGGNKMIYYASGCMLLTKRELTDEDVQNQEVQEHYKKLDDTLTAEIRKKMGKHHFVGITSTMEVLKSRVSKPFEKVDIQIPWLTGLDPYSGLFELFMQEMVVTSPSSGWYAYFKADGTEVKFRKKDFISDGHADYLMSIADQDISTGKESTITPESVPDEVAAEPAKEKKTRKKLVVLEDKIGDGGRAQEVWVEEEIAE